MRNEVAALFGREFNEPVDILCRTVRGKVVGAWAFTGIVPGENLQIHCGGRAFTKNFLRDVFQYAFDVHRPKVILAVIPDTKPGVQDLARGLGFREFGWLEELGLRFFKLLRSECKWVVPSDQLLGR